MKPVYLHEMSQFVCSAEIQENELKSQLKNNFNVVSRRTSRLTLLALLGALPLKTSQNCGVYISSSFSSPSNMYELQMHVFQNKTPRPFNFINSINNAVPFYIAQALNIKGPNLFIATDSVNWSQLLLPAIIDLQQGIIEQALVGWCYEHRQQVDKSTLEGSHWLLLSSAPQHDTIATIDVVNKQDIQVNHNNNNSHGYDNDKHCYHYQSVVGLFERLAAGNENIICHNIINNKDLFIQPLRKPRL